MHSCCCIHHQQQSTFNKVQISLHLEGSEDRNNIPHIGESSSYKNENLSPNSVLWPIQSFVVVVVTLTRTLFKATSVVPPRPPPFSWEADSRVSLACSHWPIRQYTAAALYNT